MKLFCLAFFAFVAAAFGQATTPSPYPLSVLYPASGDTEISATQKVVATQTYSNALAVTPADANLAHIAGALWVGGLGNVTVIMAGGQTVTFTAVPSGTLLRVSVTQVRAATTATNIVALY